MRDIDEAFVAALAADITTLCTCWRFERPDGLVRGATDHDAAITFEDEVYDPASGLVAATFESSAGLAPGQAAANGAISLDFLTAADIDAGLWDGARVDVWRVDWTVPARRVVIWSGRLSEITRRGEMFAAELVSLKADLERPVGRFYARTCDAEVGDGRCGANLDDVAFRGEGVVTHTLGAQRLLASGLGGFDDAWFTGGMLTWTGGANAGRHMRVLRQAGAEIELVRAPPGAIVAEDAFVVTAGCDKSFAMCGGRFSNRINFRGFPHLPGPDAMLAGPASGQNDGGKRR